MKYARAYGRMGGQGDVGRRRGRPRRREEERTTAEQRQQVRAWFAGRLPESWFAERPDVQVDDDEILVVGSLPEVELAADAGADEREVAESARIAGFREDTREPRMRIAGEAQSAFGRTVSWGATCGSTTTHFTTASIPVMTRLRLRERQILDTLIDAGVARSRSEALAWCVALVGEHEEAWIADLRSAFEHVEQVRSRGPQSGSSQAPGSGSPGEHTGE